MQVEYDPRSESFRAWCRNEDDYHFMKLVQSPSFDPCKFFKTHLNSTYGQMIYADTDSIKYKKENDKMIKGLDYILIHEDKEPIIFKNQIISIAKVEDRACIQCTNVSYLSDESYADIVKQAL